MGIITEIVVNTPTQLVDISRICESVTLNLELEGNAGQMELSYLSKHRVDISEGDTVSLKVNGKKMFYGWVFKKEIDASNSVKLKVYDIKRYLAYKDVDVTGQETIDQFFTRICTVMNIKHKVVNTSDYIIPIKIHDGETYNNMLQYAIDQTLIGTNGQQRFCVRANGDTLELVNCINQLTDILIGDKRYLTNYHFSSDIENTYTTFKVQRDVASEEQKKLSKTEQILLRTTLVSVNRENVDKWGDLQYYEKKDSKWTDTQLAQYMNHVSQVYSKKTKTLKLNCLGDTQCIPGNVILVDIADLHSENVAKRKFVLITAATHNITHNLHTMELTVEVS